MVKSEFLDAQNIDWFINYLNSKGVKSHKINSPTFELNGELVTAKSRKLNYSLLINQVIDENSKLPESVYSFFAENFIEEIRNEEYEGVYIYDVGITINKISVNLTDQKQKIDFTIRFHPVETKLTEVKIYNYLDYTFLIPIHINIDKSDDFYPVKHYHKMLGYSILAFDKGQIIKNRYKNLIEALKSIKIVS